MPKVKIELDHKDVTNGMTQMERTVNSGFNKMQKSAKNASSGVKGLQQSMQSLVSKAPSGLSAIVNSLSKLGPIGLAAGAAIAGIGLAVVGAYNGVKKLALKTDSLAKTAKSLEMTTNGYISLQYASNRTGIEMEKMNTIIQKVSYSIEKAAEGDKKYIEGFRKLGIYWRDLERYSPEMRVALLSKQIAAFNEAGKAIPTEAQEIWGRKNTADMRKAAQEDFAKHIANASVLGFTVDEKFVAQAERMADSISDADMKFYAAISKLAEQQKAMETITNIKEKITGAIGGGGRLTAEQKKFFKTVVEDFIGMKLTEDEEQLRKAYAKAKIGEAFVTVKNGQTVSRYVTNDEELMRLQKESGVTIETIREFFINLRNELQKDQKKETTPQQREAMNSLVNDANAGKKGFVPYDTKNPDTSVRKVEMPEPGQTPKYSLSLFSKADEATGYEDLKSSLKDITIFESVLEDLASSPVADFNEELRRIDESIAKSKEKAAAYLLALNNELSDTPNGRILKDERGRRVTRDMQVRLEEIKIKTLNEERDQLIEDREKYIANIKNVKVQHYKEMLEANGGTLNQELYDAISEAVNFNDAQIKNVLQTLSEIKNGDASHERTSKQTRRQPNQT